MTINNSVGDGVPDVPQNKTGNPQVAQENKIYQVAGDGVPDVPHKINKPK